MNRHWPTVRRNIPRHLRDHTELLTYVIVGGMCCLGIFTATATLLLGSNSVSMVVSDLRTFAIVNAVAALVGLYFGGIVVAPILPLVRRKRICTVALTLFTPATLGVYAYVVWPPGLGAGVYPLPAAGVAVVIIFAMAVIASFVLRDDPKLCPPGVCPQCGYNISGSATPGCPECGWGR